MGEINTKEWGETNIIDIVYDSTPVGIVNTAFKELFITYLKSLDKPKSITTLMKDTGCSQQILRSFCLNLLDEKYIQMLTLKGNVFVLYDESEAELQDGIRNILNKEV